ncbi:MAG TPA: FecR family protein [Chitinophagaceae bacterium]|nr:FecR family protein [Chitinophagaceae bacterium]
MKDFSLFEIADFVMDEDFIRWVNNRSKDDDIFWENWLRRNPHKHLIIAEARRVLESIGSEQPAVPAAVIDAEIEKLLQAIRLPQELTVTPPVKRILPVFKYAAAAIVIVALLGSSALFFTSTKKQPEKFAYAAVTSSRQLIENVNTSRSTITVPLPDGSTVKLAANSRISYESGFDSMLTRDVYLSGQAFFNVTKNPHRPFRVFANEIVAKVLGTSFSVRAFDKDTTIKVTVSTGKVSVYSQGHEKVEEAASSTKPNAIIVTPNQQLVYEKASQEFQKILLENPVMVNAVSVNKSMAYEDAPIDRVFNDLGRDYGINIVYDAELLRKCTVTADLSNESFYHKLDLICRAMGAKYEVIDAQVVIQANGCQ